MDLIPECDVVYDIGCDHAWLPVALIQAGRCRSAVAVDRRPAPLARARRHVAWAGLQDRIQVCQTNGLEGLHPGPDDVIVIAGLGGAETVDVLDKAKDRLIFFRLILQPTRSPADLRRWLRRANLTILAETLCADRGRVYLNLAVARPQELPLMLSGPDGLLPRDWIGAVLPERRLEGDTAYLERLERHLTQRRIGIPDTAAAAAAVADLLARRRAEDAAAVNRQL